MSNIQYSVGKTNVALLLTGDINGSVLTGVTVNAQIFRTSDNKYLNLDTMQWVVPPYDNNIPEVGTTGLYKRIFDSSGIILEPTDIVVEYRPADLSWLVHDYIEFIDEGVENARFDAKLDTVFTQGVMQVICYLYRNGKVDMKVTELEIVIKDSSGSVLYTNSSTSPQNGQFKFIINNPTFITPNRIYGMDMNYTLTDTTFSTYATITTLGVGNIQ